MSRKRLQLFGQSRSVEVEVDATIGATIGVNLYGANGELYVPPDAGVPGSPGDSFTYWRLIQEIPLNVVALEEASGAGLFAVVADGAGAFREIVSSTLEITFGDGVDGDPDIELAVLPDTGFGAALVKTTRDAYGRVEGTEEATTDDLDEGADNLYFTEDRARAAAVADEINPAVVNVAPSQRAVAEAISAIELTPGPPGKDGQIRYTGHGAPGVIVGANPGDTYLDLDTGDIYKLT